MALNPETNKFESLTQIPEDEFLSRIGKLSGDFVNLVRPNGSLVPRHWLVFVVGEKVVIKDHTFKVAYIGESNILFEPVSPVIAPPKGGEA